MLHIPLGGGQTLTGTPAQFARLASYLQAHTATAPAPARLVRLQLWDAQVLVARYAALAALATALSAPSRPPLRARSPPQLPMRRPASLRAALSGVRGARTL